MTAGMDEPTRRALRTLRIIRWFFLLVGLAIVAIFPWVRSLRGGDSHVVPVVLSVYVVVSIGGSLWLWRIERRVLRRQGFK